MVTAGNGESRGQATLNNRAQNARQHIDLDCLNVFATPNGDIAMVGGVISSSTVPGEEGKPGVFGVRDNGEGKQSDPDEMTIFFTLESLEPFGLGFPCDDGIWPFLGSIGALDGFLVPVANGNIQVRD